MDHFPQELIDRICTYLSADDLASAYYISHKFRTAAEEYAQTFQDQEYSLTEANGYVFVKEYSGFKLRYLSEVEYDTHFPVLDVDTAGCRESAQEQLEKDRIFTEQIQHLFATIKLVEEIAGTRNRGNFRLVINAPSQEHSKECCPHREHAQWRTHLLEPETLPDLMSVTSLEINTDSPYDAAKLEYRLLIDIALRLPNLDTLKCHTGADEWNPRYDEEPTKSFIWEYDGPRRDSRHGFGKAITTTNIPRSLERVELDFLCGRTMEQADYVHHWKTMPNLVSPALKDPFSTSLRILSHHLRHLTLRAQVDDTLFWPENGSTPVWPNLQYLFIMFHMVTPSGAWYFEGPRGEGRDTVGYDIDESSYPPLETTEDDEILDDESAENTRHFWDYTSFSFRISPNDRIIAPFLKGFAKAASNMPELKQAVLWSPLRWEVYCEELDIRKEFRYFSPPDEDLDYLAWGLAYYQPGENMAFATNPGEVNCEARQIWWKVGAWRPDAEVHDHFRQIGRRRHGDALIEHWGDDRLGENLVWRGYFEDWTPEN